MPGLQRQDEEEAVCWVGENGGGHWARRGVLAGFSRTNRFVGLVVKASASRAEGPGFESHLRRDFFGVESYQ